MAKAAVVIPLVIIAGAIAWLWSSCSCGGNKKPPVLDPEEWWGPDELKTRNDISIRNFQVSFSPLMLDDLKTRLKNHRKFTPPLEGVAFEYGFNSDQLDSWLTYWAEKYPFTEREKFFNQFQQFKTNIQGLDIHFIRVKPKVPSGVETVPLLLLHGWPGSVREFYEAIPLLTQHQAGYDFAFEVIVPSLPGYGFSDAPVRPGLAPPQIAVIMRNLMRRLGFKQYYIQGGDAGAVIAYAIATFYPDEVLGHHSNMMHIQNSCTMLKTFIGAYFPSLVVEPHLADRMYPLSSFFAYLMEEFGYLHLHATKPDTVGVALSDSPAGLLAYILEKFSTWTNPELKRRKDGGLDYRFSKDQLIDNLMVYWSTNSITTSMRLYAENFSQKNRDMDLDSVKTPVPTWVVQAKHELFYQPPELIKSKFTNLIHTTVLDDGGHFLAFELPKVFAEDVFKAVIAFREWHGNNVKTEL